jgi:hypothetical protein
VSPSAPLAPLATIAPPLLPHLFSAPLLLTAPWVKPLAQTLLETAARVSSSILKLTVASVPLDMVELLALSVTSILSLPEVIPPLLLALLAALTLSLLLVPNLAVCVLLARPRTVVEYVLVAPLVNNPLLVVCLAPTAPPVTSILPAAALLSTTLARNVVLVTVLLIGLAAFSALQVLPLVTVSLALLALMEAILPLAPRNVLLAPVVLRITQLKLLASNVLLEPTASLSLLAFASSALLVLLLLLELILAPLACPAPSPEPLPAPVLLASRTFMPATPVQHLALHVLLVPLPRERLALSSVLAALLEP